MKKMMSFDSYRDKICDNGNKIRMTCQYKNREFSLNLMHIIHRHRAHKEHTLNSEEHVQIYK